MAEFAASSIRPVQPSQPQYDPLPLDGARDDPFSPLASPSVQSSSIPMQEIPAGAAIPRFQGAALLEDGNQLRNSYASATTHNPPESLNSSVYALNPAHGNQSSQLLAGYRDDPGTYESPASGYADPNGSNKYLENKRDVYQAPRDKSRKKGLLIGAAVLLAAIAVAIVVAIYFTVIKKNNSNDGGKSSSSSPSSTGPPSNNGGTRNFITGGDGSIITMEDGTKFTYKNSFGGYWYFDPEDPFNNAARTQSWNPALNGTFHYGQDAIRGVNLGGWLNTEPFMQVLLPIVTTPALYEKYLNSSTPAVDEWTLSENMRQDPAGIQQLEEHYKTFITEQDFAQIAGAGLNFVRIPLPYWAIETRANEPFLAKTCWKYFLKAIQWARKYGIRINLDFHALPGSQNGWNHSGKLGSINVLKGPMGYANAQRSLDYIRILTEFISQPQYKDVVVMLGITNEPQASDIGQDVLSKYYMQAYNIVRNVGGIGEGNGPFISYHDGFLGQPQWAGFMTGADRISLDSHEYLCFTGQSSAPLSTFADTACSAWGGLVNTSMGSFGLSTVGEFSLATNDCGEYVNGVNLGTRYEGTYTGTWPRIGSCDPWLNYASWNNSMKADYKAFALASMDALQNWFFWTWKIGNSSLTGTVMAPQWSYQLGLQNGWLPTDPRDSVGKCGGASIWQGPLKSYQTGGAGAGDIPASVTSSLAWPPASISNGGAIALLPSYTPTAAVPTLPGPTFTATSGKTTKTISGGSGWANTADTAGLMTNIAGCNYLDPWVGSAAPPSPLCTAAQVRRETLPEPVLTGSPNRR